MTDQGITPPEPLDLAAIRAEAASLTEGPEFESSLHIGGMEQDLARFVLDRVPALLAALDAAEAEIERLRAECDRAWDVAMEVVWPSRPQPRRLRRSEGSRVEQAVADEGRAEA